MSAARTRSTVPVDCPHTTVKHEHGTRAAYQADKCGCTPCLDANRAYEHELKAQPPASSITARGLFVVVWPYFGGMSRQRVARVVRPDMVAIAAAQEVQLLAGDPRIRLTRTGAGAFVVAEQLAVSYQPVADVRARAQEFAYEHEQAIPDLSRWITKQMEAA